MTSTNKQYWLMKSEPDEFSIDDLAQRKNQIEPWSGVRNFQVRTWIKNSMRKGDLAFFYHSSCKIPGVAGIIKIVTDAYPDPTAFDLQSDYYDPRGNPERPTWYCVDVQLVKKFPRFVPLQELRATPALQTMRILERGSRLSITPVTQMEWEIIVDLGSRNQQMSIL